MKDNIFFLWLDDIRPFGGGIGALHDYSCGTARSVNQAKNMIMKAEENGCDRFILDLDHDLGDFAFDGGDGYELVNWLIKSGRNTGAYHIQCHSMNPVGKAHILGLKDRYFPPFNEDFFFEKGDYADYDCE